MNDILKELRIEKGYTQEYMAKQLGYKDKSGYNHLENGNVKLSLDRAIEISNIFKVSPSIFFTKKVQESSTNEN